MADEIKPPAMGPGRRVVYRENHKSFGEFIMSEHMRDVTAEVAHDIAKLAGRLSPTRNAGVTPDGARLGDRFEVNREAGKIKVDRAFRVKVEVFNSARSAAPMEFGNKHTGKPGRRMLGRAGAAFGDFKPGKAKPSR